MSGQPAELHAGTRSSRRIPVWLDRLLSPADALGPVFVKEIRTSSRKYSPFAVRMIYVLFLLAAFWGGSEIVLANATRSGAGRVQLVQQLQFIAPAISVAVLWIQMGMLLLTAPTTTCSAFSDERQKRTLDVLLLTPIKPWRIVLGKLFSGVTQLLVLSLCSLPVLLAASVYGGLEWRWILLGTGLSLSLAMLAAMFALTFSMWMKKASGAFFLAALCTAFAQGLPILVGATIVLANRVQNANTPPSWLMGCFSASSFVGYFCLSGSTMGGGRLPIPTEWACLIGIAYSLAWVLLLFSIATVSLRKVMLSSFTGEGGARVVVAVRPVEANKGESEPANESLPRSRRVSRRNSLGSREVADEPVLWRELAQPLVRRPVMQILGVLVLGGFTAWLYIVSGRIEPETATIVTTMVFSGIMLLQAAGSTTNSISTERESKTWDTLLSTPLSARRIIWGKFAGAIKTMWLMPMVLLANIVLINVIPGRLAPRSIIHALLIIPGPLLLLAASGTYLSLVTKSASRASTRNVLFAFFMWAGIPMIAGIIIGIGQSLGWGFTSRSGAGQHIIDAAVFYNPISQIYSAVYAGSTVERGWGGPRGYSLGPGLDQISIGQYTAILGVSLIGYSGLAAAFLSLTVRTLRKQRRSMA